LISQSVRDTLAQNPPPPPLQAQQAPGADVIAALIEGLRGLRLENQAQPPAQAQPAATEQQAPPPRPRMRETPTFSGQNPQVFHEWLLSLNSAFSMNPAAYPTTRLRILT